MARLLASKIEARGERLRAYLRQSLFRIPARRIETVEQRLDSLVDGLGRRLAETFAARTRRRARAEDVLRLSDPNLPLRRGYSLTFLKGSTSPLRSIEGIEPEAQIETRLGVGRLHSRVEEVIDE
jgi:exonuclease VII large subunit